ncbi:hypothetical protein HYH03_017650 [Edaphochlamys debaryana]|uniref:Uncharacterized protein n=1 Tax=Edaphochlamys debaryana TaxID=47281 RepID=A0A835XF87_9CHLO|nr:hypothetical protein HYH03_017650 [Edaphochlamys debaryana]|eukprot:KAG2483467.1 hypothetical protein HYH03_017650 [Edaphochlamys debaryana]
MVTQYEKPGWLVPRSASQGGHSAPPPKPAQALKVEHPSLLVAWPEDGSEPPEHRLQALLQHQGSGRRGQDGEVPSPSRGPQPSASPVTTPRAQSARPADYRLGASVGSALCAAPAGAASRREAGLSPVSASGGFPAGGTLGSPPGRHRPASSVPSPSSAGGGGPGSQPLPTQSPAEPPIASAERPPSVSHSEPAPESPSGPKRAISGRGGPGPTAQLSSPSLLRPPELLRLEVQPSAAAASASGSAGGAGGVVVVSQAPLPASGSGGRESGPGQGPSASLGLPPGSLRQLSMQRSSLRLLPDGEREREAEAQAQAQGGGAAAEAQQGGGGGGGGHGARGAPPVLRLAVAQLGGASAAPSPPSAATSTISIPAGARLQRSPSGPHGTSPTSTALSLTTAPTHAPSLPVPGLPSFLGAPVVLDSQPHAGHSGSLAPAFSRSASGAERGPHGGPLPAPGAAASTTPGGAAGIDSGAASRTRYLHIGSTSHRSNASRNSNGSSFRRSGSYFRVREAVPEAVFDNVPGLQASRGLQPPPSHPGGVPDLGPPPSAQPLLLSVAPAGQAQGHRNGQDLASAAAFGSAVGGSHYGAGGGGGGIAALLTSGGSSPMSGTLSGGALPGAYLSSGATHGGGASPANWLRRSEAVPPPDLLPILPKPPPMGMDHVVAASGTVAATVSLAWPGAADGAVGGAGAGGRPASPLNDVPGAAAMAAAAAADADSQSGSDELSESPSPERISPPTRPAAVTRATFKTQSKLRLLHMGLPMFGLGGGGGDSPSAAAAAASEQEAVLAMLGSTRMLSSVLTATAGPARLGHAGGGSGSGDGAIHGPRDPNYDPTAHIPPIPESMAWARAPSTSGSGHSGGVAGLMGGTRMGSTVFSPPPTAAAMAKLSGMRHRRHASARPASDRASQPDLALLSKRSGTTVVVTPDGRTVQLTATPPLPPPSGTDALELASTDELVPAVNGHVAPRHHWQRSPSALAAVGSSGGSGSAFARERSSAVATVAGESSDDGNTEDGAAAGVGPAAFARRAKSFRALGPGKPSGALSGPSSGRPSGGSMPGASAVASSASQHREQQQQRDSGASLRRHASMPTRRGMLGSGSGAPPPLHTTASGSGPGAAAPHTPPGHKHSFFAGLSGLLKRAFTIRPSAPDAPQPLPPRVPTPPGPAPTLGSNTSAGGAPPPNSSWHGSDSWLVHGDWQGDETGPTFSTTNRERPLSDQQQPSTPSGTGRAGPGPVECNSWGPDAAASSVAPSSAQVTITPTASRKMLASQKSFLKHSAVLGWVQQMEHADALAAAGGSGGGGSRSLAATAAGGGSGGTGFAGESDSGDMMPPLDSRKSGGGGGGAAGGGALARLHSLQALLASGGGALTCDAVVAFEDGDGANVGRRRRSNRDSFRRRGSQAESEETDEDGTHGSGQRRRTSQSQGVGAHRPGPSSAQPWDPTRPMSPPSAGGWVAPTHAVGSAADGRASPASALHQLLHPGAAHAGHHIPHHAAGVRAGSAGGGSAPLSPAQLGPTSSITSANASAGGAHGESAGGAPSTLLARIGSKLSRGGRRSLVFPSGAGHQDAAPGGGGAGVWSVGEHEEGPGSASAVGGGPISTGGGSAAGDGAAALPAPAGGPARPASHH